MDSPTPDGDYEYDRERTYRYTSGSASMIPEIVKEFIRYLQNAINECHVYEIQDLYENTFPKLSDEFYDRSSWPDEESVIAVIGDDKRFLTLYKELYYRHIYARVPSGPTFQERINSFYNYCDLFNYIMTTEYPVSLELPDVWLWELIDEFIYQFQTFTQYRARSKKSPEEIELIRSQNKVWSVLCVLNVLHSLISKSNIKQQLEVMASGGDPETVAGEFGSHSLYRMLGCFSLVGLLRLHSLLGDYYQAVKALENIDIHKKGLFSTVPACQITIAYYVGFAYMMMRRYADAIRIFTSILLYLQRTKQLFQTRSVQNDLINKQTDQMYNLLAMCLVLYPQSIDESIQMTLREKNYHEKTMKMQYGDVTEFENCFTYACPKFLSPNQPPLDGPMEDCSKDALRHQTQIFMDEVRQQKILPTIRSYLKLYKTLPLSKLASFMSQNSRKEDVENQKEIRALITNLLCFKHKMKNLVCIKGTNALEGVFESGSELDFFIDNDMIHIADTKVATRHADVFIRKIFKFQELHQKIKSLKVQ